MTPHRINGDRLWDSLMEMAKIGATDLGGSKRLAMSDLDQQGRDLFSGWCRDAGFQVSSDRVGNMFVRREGRDPDLPPVVLGSHLDTQPTGGKFDGVFGVLAGLEVLRTLDDLGLETQCAIEVANWTNEEGSRFSPAMMGSGVFTGVFDLDETRGATDIDGITLGEELDRLGYSDCQPAKVCPFKAYLEAHIEQGPILFDKDIPIGVVTGGQGIRWYDVTIEGQEAHAGPTPMNLRRDALAPAIRLIDSVQRIDETFDPLARGTIGEMRTLPGSRNVIPGRIEMTVDLRHEDESVLDDMHAHLHDLIHSLQEDFPEHKINLQDFWYSPPTPFDENLVQAVRKSADLNDYAHMDIVSGAGHDAIYLARVAPTAMIFIPCRDGISHNEIEHAEPEHITAGGNVLLNAALEASTQ